MTKEEIEGQVEPEVKTRKKKKKKVNSSYTRFFKIINDSLFQKNIGKKLRLCENPGDKIPNSQKISNSRDKNPESKKIPDEILYCRKCFLNFNEPT